MTTLRIIGFIWWIPMALFVIAAVPGWSQELYPNSEAASNSPKDVLRLRLMTMIDPYHGEAITGIKGMYTLTDALQASATVNMSTWLSDDFPGDFSQRNPLFRSATIYGKYRFYTDDEHHKHLRFAAFAEYDYAPNSVSLDSYIGGVKNGVSGGVIGTFLANRTALSAMMSYFKPIQLGEAQTLDGSIVNYSLSLGHLVLPLRYTSYDDVNVNLYCEVLGYVYFPIFEGGLSLHHGAFAGSTHLYNRLDIVPAVQVIFSSRAKIDVSARTQIFDDYYARPHWMFMAAFEYYFF